MEPFSENFTEAVDSLWHKNVVESVTETTEYYRNLQSSDFNQIVYN